jgi:NADH-quinone oxidoreductase subunit D
MKLDQILQKSEETLAPWAKETTRPEPNRVDVTMEPGDLAAAGAALRREKWGYLAAITGLDQGVEADKVEALYHFCEGPVVTTLRVQLPRKGGVVPTLYQDYPVASFFERELGEMYGVTVEGTPDTSRLFIPDDFPDGIYPMLKDFNAKSVLIRKPTPPPLEAVSGDGKFVVPIGPQHPALKEPGHFEFGVDGEIVTSARMRLGYVHRGIEKACEEQNWIQDLYLLERICGICSHSHATAYAIGVEKLAQVEVSERAHAIRELFAGLERIHSHLLWLGVAAHEAGYDTLFMYSWRDRETVMDILEQIGGNRVNYSISVLGGVKEDIEPQDADAIRKGMIFLEERINHYLDVVTTDQMFLQRTRGIGHMTREQAEFLGILGPTARASGVVRDVRVEAPYGTYTRFPVSLVTEEAGDIEARFKVRLREMIVSTHAIRTIVDNLPEGELAVKMPRRIPAGETISRVEAPRGELFYYIKSNGTDKPERIKVRTPSLCNWTYVLTSAIGRQLADVPLLLAGMDPCFSCNDR